MKIIAICMLLWVAMGGTPMWLILAFLLWICSGRGTVLTALWISNKIHDRDDRNHGP